MKLAVCFFGHLRTYKRCASYVKSNLLRHYDCDLFMHTWSDYNHQTKTWHNNRPISGKVSKQEIIDTYGDFKSIVIEDQVIEDMGDVTVASDNIQTSLFGIKSMYHSMQASYNLCEQYALENHINYDLVIMIRPDIALSNRFYIESYISVLTNEELADAFFTVSNNLSPINTGFRYLRAVDLLFFAKPFVISSIVNHTNRIVHDLSERRIINCSPEFKFIELVKSLNYVPYEVKYKGWSIVRPIQLRSFIKQIISVRIRKNYIKVRLFRFLMMNVFSVRINLFNFEVECCIGKSYSE